MRFIKTDLLIGGLTVAFLNDKLGRKPLGTAISFLSIASQDYRLGIFTIASFWLVGFTSFLIYSIKGKETKGKPIEQIS